MELEYKTFKAQKIDAKEGIIEAIVSVFNNIDQVGERIIQGAFSKSLATKMPKGVWAHSWRDPVAKTLEARELGPGDPLLPESLKNLGGLYIKGQFNLNTTRGKDAFSDIDFGIIDEFSIGYRVVKAAWDSNSETRDLQELNLYEWSPVLFGANQATRLIGAKSLAGLTTDEQAETVLATVKEYAQRLREINELRGKEGRSISGDRLKRFQQHADSLQAVVDDLKTIISEASKPEKTADSKSLKPADIYAQFLQIESNSLGVF